MEEEGVLPVRPFDIVTKRCSLSKCVNDRERGIRSRIAIGLWWTAGLYELQYRAHEASASA